MESVNKKRVCNLIIFFIGLLIGFALALISLRYKYFIYVMKKVNWSALFFWLSLFLGALIPIIINYLFIKKQEVIRLKAKLAQDKLDIIREYSDIDILFRTTVLLEYKVSDLHFNYEPTSEDLSAPTIRGLYILSDRKIYSDFKFRFFNYSEKLKELKNNKVNNYLWYIQSYLLNLDLLLEQIPEKYYFEVSVAVKNDFFSMSIEFSNILDSYLNYNLYTFKNNVSKIDRNRYSEITNEKLQKSNLIKYKNNLQMIDSIV